MKLTLNRYPDVGATQNDPDGTCTKVQMYATRDLISRPRKFERLQPRFFQAPLTLWRQGENWQEGSHLLSHFRNLLGNEILPPTATPTLVPPSQVPA